MLENALFGETLQTMQKALDVRMMRQNMIASNIANSETPGYRALDIDFEATMKNFSSKLDVELNGESGPGGINSLINSSNIEESDIVYKTDDGVDVGQNSNTVSMEKEMGKLQENKVMFEVLAQLMAKKFRGLNDVISGGGQR